MKTLKTVIASFILLSFFSFELRAQAQVTKSEDFPIQFWCKCAGGLMVGTMNIKTVINDNIVHYNIKAKDLTGYIWVKGKGWTESGKYSFSRVSNFNPESGDLVLNIRNVRTYGVNTGIVTNMHGHGPAEDLGDDYLFLKGARIRFVCGH